MSVEASVPPEDVTERSPCVEPVERPGPGTVARTGEPDWRVMADATCAGLAVLVPLPLLDVALERLFRRRMAATICQVRGVTADPAVLTALARPEPLLGARGCLTAPLALVLWVVRRLSRKLLYFLTVREAVNAVSAYWHRAHVIDHMALAGHLSPGRSAAAAAAALERALREADGEGLVHLARQVVAGSSHVLRRLLRARSRGASAELAPESAFLAGQWAVATAQLDRAVARYDAAYAELQGGPPPLR